MKTKRTRGKTERYNINYDLLNSRQLDKVEVDNSMYNHLPNVKDADTSNLSDAMIIDRFFPTNQRQFRYYPEENVKSSIQEFLKDTQNRIEEFEINNHLKIQGKSIRSLISLKQDIDKLALKHFGEELVEDKI